MSKSELVFLLSIPVIMVLLYLTVCFLPLADYQAVIEECVAKRDLPEEACVFMSLYKS